MNLLRNPLVWQGLFVGLFLIALIADHPSIAMLLPFVVIAALLYLLAKIFWFWGRRSSLNAMPSTPDRTPRQAPPIIGDVGIGSVAESIDPDAMRTYLASRVIGQDDIALQLSRGIWRRLAQQRRNKPIFTALLSGPTGVGKTELAKAVADYLYGGKGGLFRIDCANVIGEAGLQTLIGSPKGYAGSGSWGALTAHLRSTPNTVLLFDEIEKAVTSPTAPMAKLLLSLLDEGLCTEQSDGTKVSANDAIILMTSNAAQQRLAELYRQFENQAADLTRATKDALRDVFAPEFLARIDLVTTLSPLNDLERAQIIAMHAGRIAEGYGLNLSEIDADFINAALHRWQALEGYGTREIIRWIEDVAADRLINAKASGATNIVLGWQDEKVEVR